MYKVYFSPLAKDDLMKINEYLQEEFGKETANFELKKLIESIKNFEQFPLMGRPLVNLIDIPTEYMYFVTERNYVFYRLENHKVKIIRILDIKQDYIQILFGNR